MPRFARLTEKWDIIWHTDSITHVLCTPYKITIFSIMLSSITDLVNTSPIPVWWSLYHYPNIARRRRKFFRVLLCKHTVRCRSDSWWSLILNCSYYMGAAGENFWGCDTNLQILKGLHEARDFSEEDLLMRVFYASHGGVTPSHYFDLTCL